MCAPAQKTIAKNLKSGGGGQRMEGKYRRQAAVSPVLLKSAESVLWAGERNRDVRTQEIAKNIEHFSTQASKAARRIDFLWGGGAS